MKPIHIRHWEVLEDPKFTIFIDAAGHFFIMKKCGRVFHDSYGDNDEIEIYFDAYEDEEGNFFAFTWFDDLKPINPEDIEPLDPEE